MRRSSVVKQLLGVDKAIVEKVEFVDGVWSCMCGCTSVSSCGAVIVGSGVVSTTMGVVGGVGGRWILVPRRSGWRPMRRGSGVVSRGVAAARVTWARAGHTGYSRVFEDQVAWLAAKTTQSVISEPGADRVAQCRQGAHASRGRAPDGR